MSLRATMVRDDSLRVTDSGVEVGVHLPWFRSLPLSCVETCRVAIADSEIPPADLLFRLGDEEWLLAELAGLHDREWFVLDEARLYAPAGPSPQPGETVEISVEMAIRIPDIIIAPGMAFTSRQSVARWVTVV